MRGDVREGMRVFTADGTRLGTVVGCGEETFAIEGGLLRLKAFTARYGDVVDVREGDVHLGLTRDEVSPAEEGAGHAEGGGTESVLAADFATPSELVIPLAREEAHPRVVVHETGQVRIHKVVRTEVRHFTVPVRREELVVERVSEQVVAAEGPRATSAPARPVLEGLVPFEAGTFVIPLHEERVELTKTVHVWQEVAVSRYTAEALQKVHATVRKETAEVEERGEVLHDGPVDGLHS
ncbi:YsnF/AvaK domain-containing protein [Myxococcus sp. Y35]|uniref:YsnF/AvaK domain-containing protein n=1 Tax=Pseudomyxococcus flavus TaxID=3115648 RepID=UPI003CE95248